MSRRRMAGLVLGYLVGRLGLFAAAASVLLLAGLRGPIVFFAALIVSMPLSLLLQKRHRRAIEAEHAKGRRR